MTKVLQDLVTQMYRLVDAEYESLAGYDRDEFYSYMTDAFPGVTKAMTDEVWDTTIGESMKRDRAIEKLITIAESEESFTTATLDNVDIGANGIKINALIQPDSGDDFEVNWTYDPKTDKVNADTPMNSPLGYLLLTLLLNAGSISREEFDKMSEVLG